MAYVYENQTTTWVEILRQEDRYPIRNFSNYRYKVLKENPEEVALWLAFTKSRTKKLDRYQKEILDWLRKHPDTSAAIVHDRLEEKYPDLSVAESTVRAYINDLRKEYKIAKIVEQRTYEAAPEFDKLAVSST